MDRVFDILAETGWYWTIAFGGLMAAHAVWRFRRASRKEPDAANHE